jgi:hypothetical protein
MGTFEVRTAIYRLTPVVSVLLSNGDLPCGEPDYTLNGGEQYAEMLLAMCREDAQLVTLKLYGLPGVSVGGTYTGVTTDTEDVVSEDVPRTANATYFGVEEAALAESHDLQRLYWAKEFLFLDELGDGGAIDVELSGSRLEGSFDIPDTLGGDVSGEFRATECTGDDSIFDVVNNPTNDCSPFDNPLLTL